ncbi:hypothetical protein F5Y01DRAFT_306352 [Xylaria sp. FL0043]|nr:hypothetical protein F5Y01DRAFT_306352 [Xylaria sp. FL0043]
MLQPNRLAQRKSAKKSRYGCLECKRRHVKCDETRPSCANCTVRKSPCSFLSTTACRPPTHSSVSSSSPSSVSASASGSPQPDDAALSSTALSTRRPAGDALVVPTPWSLCEPSLTINSLVSTNQTFKLHHLELLYNFKAGVLEESVLQLSAAEGYMAMTVREAAQAPYLMDQVLAVSAANMSVKRPRERRFYQEEAIRLQTRGLALFNACRAVEMVDHTMARFIFSTLLSYQALFDAFSVRSSFPMLLDRLVAAFRICNGVRAMCGEFWPTIITLYEQNVGINLPGEFVASCDRPGFLKYLTSRLIQWPVVVPTEFINLVEERRPEALIVIAYYAVLMHDTKGYWVSGDAGAFIIRSITHFLGNHWAEWLRWPNEILNSNTEVSSLSRLDIDMDHTIDHLP